MPVKKGDQVAKDQVLLELWNEDIRAELAVTNATPRLRARGATSLHLGKVARRESDRLASLVERKLVSVELTERAAGEPRAVRPGAGPRPSRSALPRQDRCRTCPARAHLLRAPFAGTVAEINGEIGEFVTPSPVGIPTPPAVDVVDNSCIYITRPSTKWTPARPRGHPAHVTLDAFKDRTFPAHVRRVLPMCSIPRSRLARSSRGRVDERGDAVLLPGYSADVEVIIAEHADSLRIRRARW